MTPYDDNMNKETLSKFIFNYNWTMYKNIYYNINLWQLKIMLSSMILMRLL